MTVRLFDLAELPRGDILRRIFSEQELQRETRLFMPYIDLDVANSHLAIWIVGMAYPLVIPRRWFSGGRMIGMKISASIADSQISIRKSDHVTPADIELLRFEFTADHIALSTAKSSIAATFSGLSLSQLIPLGNETTELNDIGRKIGKY